MITSSWSQINQIHIFRMVGISIDLNQLNELNDAIKNKLPQLNLSELKSFQVSIIWRQSPKVRILYKQCQRNFFSQPQLTILKGSIWRFWRNHGYERIPYIFQVNCKHKLNSLGIDLDPRRNDLPIHGRVIHILIDRHSWGTGMPSVVHQLACGINLWFLDRNLAFAAWTGQLKWNLGHKNTDCWLESSSVVNKIFNPLFASGSPSSKLHSSQNGALGNSWNVLGLH